MISKIASVFREQMAAAIGVLAFGIISAAVLLVFGGIAHMPTKLGYEYELDKSKGAVVRRPQPSNFAYADVVRDPLSAFGSGTRDYVLKANEVTDVRLFSDNMTLASALADNAATVRERSVEIEGLRLSGSSTGLVLVGSAPVGAPKVELLVKARAGGSGERPVGSLYALALSELILLVLIAFALGMAANFCWPLFLAMLRSILQQKQKSGRRRGPAKGGSPSGVLS